MSDKRPWVRWFGGDWRKDVRLRRVGYAPRGLWADMCALAQDESEVDAFGYMIIDGVPLEPEDLARLFGGSTKEVAGLLAKLETNKVFSRVGDPDLDEDLVPLIPEVMPKGTIFSRRMVRDKAREEQARTWGRGGGNPQLKGGDKPEGKPPKPTGGLTPPLIPQNPESRSQSQNLGINPENRESRSRGSPPARARGKTPNGSLEGIDWNSIVGRMTAKHGFEAGKAWEIAMRCGERIDLAKRIQGAMRKAEGRGRSAHGQIVTIAQEAAAGGGAR